MTDVVGVVVAVGVGAAVTLMIVQISRIILELRDGRRDALALKDLKEAEAVRSVPKPQFLRVAGRTVALEDWSPEVLEEIQKQYFRPSIKGQRVAVLDLTATCPRSHATRERVVFIGRDIALVKELSDGMLSTREITDDRPKKALAKGAIPAGPTIVTETSRSRMEINCSECGKRAKLSGRSIVWEGAGEDWDGAL